MTLQPAAVLFPDAELLTTTYLRAALATRSEPFAASVRVSNGKSGSGRQVVVRRDGGPVRGLFEFPRLTLRVWADREQDAADLSRLVQALMLAMPGTGPVIRASSLSGPQGIPDESQPQKLLSVELQIRGVNL